jgi:hypothetical protein
MASAAAVADKIFVVTSRWLAVLALLTGCDGVFGLTKLPAVPVDVDAPPSDFALVNETHSHSNGADNALTYPLVVEWQALACSVRPAT